jgi:hypothetical protein
MSYWEVDEYREIPLEKQGGMFSGIFDLMGGDKAKRDIERDLSSSYSSDYSDATSEQSSLSEVVPYRPPSPRHETERKVDPTKESPCVKSRPKFREEEEEEEEEEEDSEDSSADTVNFETACQIVMYDTLLMWKDPPPPSPKLIEGPKEDSFSQVMNDTLLLWKTPHSPHRCLRIEESQRRLYESDSCASSRYSHISAESSSKFSNASLKGPSKSACRNALEQLQKKQKSELPTTENPFQSEAMMRLYDRDKESHKLLGKRNRSVSSLGDTDSIVSFSSTDFPITSVEGSHNAMKESFILEKPFTTLPVPTSLDLGAIQGLQVTAPPLASPQADFSTTFAQFSPKEHAQGISSACMQDRDKIVHDKVTEIKMKKNLYNEGRSGKTEICLSPEATAFLDNRAADHSVPFEDPTLLKLAAELDSLRSRLSTSENVAVSKFARSIGEGTDIDEATVLTLTSHASTLNDQSETPPMTNTPEIALLCEATVRNAPSSSSTQIDAEDLDNENVDTDKEQNVTSLTQDTTACSPGETLTWSSNDIESPVETSEVKSVKTPAEARKERLVTLMSTVMKTPAEARKERLVSLMSKLANVNTKTEEESDLVHESKGGENPSSTIAHISDDEESTHASSLCSKQDDVTSQNERNHIAVTCQNSFLPTLETAMSLISFAAVDPTLASIIEENECPYGDEEMYPTANAIESCSTKEEYQVAPALDTLPSSISFGMLDHNPSMISFATTDVAPLTIEPGEVQIESSSRKTPDNLYGKVEQTLPLPETTKTAQLPSLVPTVAKSSGAVSSISKTRAGSLRPSTVKTVKSILKALVTGDQPDLDTVRALIIKSKAPRLNEEEIMTEAMSWSAAGKADPINILLKDMELYAVHEKVHYGELSSAGVFLIQSSDVIRSFIDDQKRSSKTLQVADPVLCHEAQKESDVSDDIQGPFCGNHNKTTQYTAGSNVVSQDFSSSKPSDDVVDSAPSVAAPVVAAASTVNPSFSQEASPFPDPINVNSLMTNQCGVTVRAPGQDRRLPKPPMPELEAARFADSESEKRSRSISLTEAGLDMRLPKSRAPSPESELARLTDSDSEKQEQPVSLADAGPDKKLLKASLPESGAARFVDSESETRSRSISLTEAGLDMRLRKSKAPSLESEAEKLTDSGSEKRKQSISLADLSPNNRLPKTPLPESEVARSANSGSQIRKQSSSITDAGADKRLSKHPSPESEAEKLIDSGSEKHEQPVSLADASPDKRLPKTPLPESEAARFADSGSQIRKQSSSITDAGAHKRLSKHPSPESEAEKLTDSGSEKQKQSISLADASPDKRLPKTPLPESEAAAFADSGSQIRKQSSSLTDAGADKRLSKHPFPESEAENLTDSEKRKQSISLADASPDKRLPKTPLPESEAASFADSGSQRQKQSSSLTDAGKHMRLSKHPFPESEAEKLTDPGSEKRKQSISFADASLEKRQPKTTLPESEPTRFADSSSQRQKKSYSLTEAGTHKRLPKAPSPESETDRFTDSGSQRRKQSNSLSGLVTKLEAVKKARPKIEVHDSKETEGGVSSTKDAWPNLRDRVTASVPWDGKKDEVSTDLAPPKKNGHIALSSVIMKLKTTPMQSYRKDKAITPPASSEIALDESKPASSGGSASLEAVVRKMKMATGAALSREVMRQQTVRK